MTGTRPGTSRAYQSPSSGLPAACRGRPAWMPGGTCWQRAGTLNLHIRYGQMSLALVAQAALHQLRQRLGEPFCHWDAPHFARQLFGGLEGDVCVHGDTPDAVAMARRVRRVLEGAGYAIRPSAGPARASQVQL